MTDSCDHTRILQTQDLCFLSFSSSVIAKLINPIGSRNVSDADRVFVASL